MFEKAFKKTSFYEGGYSNHSKDNGGETYKGISRVYHSKWEGWKIIDKFSDKSDLQYNKTLQKQVKEFYKEKFWDSVKLDMISILYEKTAIELFDIAVNMGTQTAGKMFQRALNILNRDELNYSDLKVDGLIGKNTLNSLDIYNKKNNETDFLKLILLLKAKKYIDIVESNTNQEVFIRGWLKRINLFFKE